MAVSFSFSEYGPLWLRHLFFNPVQIDLSQMKWNTFLFLWRETAETTIWWNVNINLQSVHFYDRPSPEQMSSKQVFMSLTSVSNISQLKIKEKFVLQLLLPLRISLLFYWKRERHKMKFWNSADLIKCSKGRFYYVG